MNGIASAFVGRLAAALGGQRVPVSGRGRGKLLIVGIVQAETGAATETSTFTAAAEQHNAGAGYVLIRVDDLLRLLTL